jgi:hypothetical protein
VIPLSTQQIFCIAAGALIVLLALYLFLRWPKGLG